MRAGLARLATMRALLRTLPDVARLLTRLVSDPVLPRPVKIALAAAVVLDGILNYVDRRLVLKYWPGTAPSLDRLARAARLLSIWVPTRLKARIFSPR